MNAQLSRWLFAAAVALLAAVAGFWLARDVVETASRDGGPADGGRASMGVPRQIDLPNPPRKSQHREGTGANISLEDLLHGVPKERIVRFNNDEAYRRFLSRLDDSNLRLLGRLDRLRALRIGYDDLDDLSDLLGPDAEDAGNYYVFVPPNPDPVQAQRGAAGFGRSTLEWLGITTDNSSWGEGVRIAILDTGVGTHDAFPNGIRQIDLVSGDGPPLDLHRHGTAVASLIAGSSSFGLGIAPAADLLSIRIADNEGFSNSFLLAEGILTAVEEGAQIVNISLGSYGNSGLVRDAIAYARENGVVIVAAAGNDGVDSPTYPAAYEEVLAVGAVDANGQRLAFSNQGEALDLAAPGFELAAAILDGDTADVSGTSFSAPLVVGSIAAAITEMGPLHVDVATDLVLRNLNAAGAPGLDPEYGEGIIDVGRVMNSETPGIYDAAIASNWYNGPGEGAATGTLLVTVENRGTEPLAGTRVEVRINDGVYQLSVPTLQPGRDHVLTLPVNAPVGTESVSVSSVLTAGNGLDRKPENDSLSGRIILVAPDTEEDSGNAEASRQR